MLPTADNNGCPAITADPLPPPPPLPVQALAQEVACYLGVDLGGIKIKRFADGEVYVQVEVGRPSQPPTALTQA